MPRPFAATVVITLGFLVVRPCAAQEFRFVAGTGGSVQTSATASANSPTGVSDSDSDDAAAQSVALQTYGPVGSDYADASGYARAVFDTYPLYPADPEHPEYLLPSALFEFGAKSEALAVRDESTFEVFASANSSYEVSQTLSLVDAELGNGTNGILAVTVHLNWENFLSSSAVQSITTNEFVLALSGPDFFVFFERDSSDFVNVFVFGDLDSPTGFDVFSFGPISYGTYYDWKIDWRFPIHAGDSISLTSSLQRGCGVSGGIPNEAVSAVTSFWGDLSMIALTEE